MIFKWTYCYILVMKFYVSMGITGCRPGYYGLNCTLPCRFPNYGIDCQSGCQCNEIQCDNTIGCRDYTVTEVSEYVQEATKTILPKLFYATYNINSTDKETQNQRSTWAGLSLTKKSMLISICIIGPVFLIMIGIYVTWKAKESALVHLFRSKWKFGRSPRNDTFAL
ncbi:uncharacterized protein LOC128182956 [Crassostrea angulata]|uniref:uncharacterized protein LOC128182956 n=1 Tax=Magallana angulata TaxID=2784310 RepID=UPI0022B1B4E2|nr:uncharacterized protein LOC128182956 [Crassostrea angulata]